VPDTPELFEQLGLALLLGLLVGLQREHAASGLVGMRSFALITVLGTVAARLGGSFGGWVVAAGFLGVLGVLAFAHLMRVQDRPSDVGITTDVAALLMYAVGNLLVVGPLAAAIVVGGGVAVLLQFKPELHSIARRLGDEDLKAVMQFVLITCIILPVLPREPFDPFHVLSLFETWLFVVLIVGINLGGYIAYKFFGQKAGTLLGGLLGGAVSSTATTVSYSRQTQSNPRLARSAAIVIMIASAVVFLRIVVLIGVVAPDFLVHAAAPLLILAVVSLVPVLVAWHSIRQEPHDMPPLGNPTQLKSAILLGLMYAIVLLAMAATREYLGRLGGQALYVVAGLSGLTDVDAITLSTARMSRTDPTIALEGWRLILVAALANLGFKAGVAGLVGGRALLRHLALLFSVPVIGGLLLLWLW
jgi:uncharacterized membrane protein (DUF4010 family)